MKLLSGFLLLISGPLLTVAIACNQDNCARAVNGSRNALDSQFSAKENCSSFLKVTVHQATATSTVTTTIYPFMATQTSTSTTVEQTTTVYPSIETDFSTITTVTETTTYSTYFLVASTETDFTTVGTITVQLQKRAITPASSAETVQPTSVPVYASPCSGTVRYSSACYCLGITKTTITMPTRTTTTTTTIIGTTTLTTDIAATKVITLSDTAPTNPLVETTTIESRVNAISITTITASSAFATSTAIVNAVCLNGSSVNGLAAPCSGRSCQNFNLRIEGVEGTVYEGAIRSGPRLITTPSGGTHLCDGTNNNANPTPEGTSITALDSASSLCGFGYDGTYDSEFQDFFITSIGSSTQTSTIFWGLLKNFQFTPVGGCQEEPAPTDEILWAYDAFNAPLILDVQPRMVGVRRGHTAVLMITDGPTGRPVSGALFAGVLSDANGKVVFTASQVGIFRYKATRDDAIRSPAMVITVTK